MEDCKNDYLMIPVTTARDCTTPASTLSGCPDVGYPVVTAIAVVPEHDRTVTLRINPAGAALPGNWVTIATGNGSAPFMGKVEFVAGNEVQVRNAMGNGERILRNPPPGTVIAQCGAFAITAEPNNVPTDPALRCTPDMAVPVANEKVGLQGLSRQLNTANVPSKCQMYVHNVGATTETFWAEALPPITPTEATDLRIAAWDTADKEFKYLAKTSTSLSFVKVGAGGKTSYADDLNGVTVPAMPTTGLPAGTGLAAYDPNSKSWYYIAPQNGKTLIGKDGAWALQEVVVGSGFLSNNSAGSSDPTVSLAVPVGKSYTVIARASMAIGSTDRYYGIIVDGAKPADGSWVSGEERAGDDRIQSTLAIHHFTLVGRTAPYIISCKTYTNITHLTAAATPSSYSGGRHYLEASWIAL